MASTTEYLRQTSFADAQAANPSAPPSGPGLDGEFDRVKLAIDSTQQSLDLIQRDDGALQNGIVTFDSLSPGLLTGLEPAERWATSTNYTGWVRRSKNRACAASAAPHRTRCLRG